MPRYMMTLCLAVTLGLAGSSSTRAQDSGEAFYAGKTLRLVVGYGAGGGYDAYARLLAPHLKARLNVVVVENRPGGGGLTALNQVAAGKADGLTLMIIDGQAAALGQLLDQPGVRFDLNRLTWLGRVVAEPRILLWSARSPFRTMADGINAPRPLKWAASGKTDSIADVIAFASEALGLNSKIIIGYKGSRGAIVSGQKSLRIGTKVFANGPENRPDFRRDLPGKSSGIRVRSRGGLVSCYHPPNSGLSG